MVGNLTLICAATINHTTRRDVTYPPGGPTIGTGTQQSSSIPKQDHFDSATAPADTSPTLKKPDPPCQ